MPSSILAIGSGTADYSGRADQHFFRLQTQFAGRQGAHPPGVIQTDVAVADIGVAAVENHGPRLAVAEVLAVDGNRRALHLVGGVHRSRSRRPRRIHQRQIPSARFLDTRLDASRPVPTRRSDPRRLR